MGIGLRIFLVNDDNEYRWTPSPELEAAIVRAIFGKNGFF